MSFGPTLYQSEADIPVGFYAAGPTFLENFEDGTLDGGITTSTGIVIPPGSSTDSVDGDDGVIDGNQTARWSLFSGSGAIGVRLDFTSVVTAAAVV